MTLYESDTLSGLSTRRFDQLQALQRQGPEVMRSLARTAWHALEGNERRDLIDEAVEVFGPNEPEMQDAFINTLLITQYISGRADPAHHFHSGIIERPTSVSGGDASAQPPAA